MAFRRPLSTSTASSWNRLDQTFTLPDGRKLGFAEYGTRPGKTLLYLHGFPSSRIEAKSIDSFARCNNIRIISLDRPGYGLSSPQPRRTLLDWPKDVEAFANGEGLERFAIMGVSGGGPFAVACAYALPRGMVSGVGLFASGPPWAAGKHHMTLTRRLTQYLAHHYPFGLQVIFNVLLGIMRRAASSTFVTRRIDTWLEHMEEKKSPKEKELPEPISEQRGYLLNLTIGEPFVQGTDAMVLEAKLLSANDWGFSLENVAYSPIRLWHGTKDTNAPIEAIRYLAEKLPGATLKEFSEDTHYTMGHHLEQAVAELMASD